MRKGKTSSTGFHVSFRGCRCNCIFYAFSWFWTRSFSPAQLLMVHHLPGRFLESPVKRVSEKLSKLNRSSTDCFAEASIKECRGLILRNPVKHPFKTRYFGLDLLVRPLEQIVEKSETNSSPLWNYHSTWTWMVGILQFLLGWPIFQGPMLVSGRNPHLFDQANFISLVKKVAWISVTHF